MKWYNPIGSTEYCEIVRGESENGVMDSTDAFWELSHRVGHFMTLIKNRKMRADAIIAAADIAFYGLFTVEEDSTDIKEILKHK